MRLQSTPPPFNCVRRQHCSPALILDGTGYFDIRYYRAANDGGLRQAGVLQDQSRTRLGRP